jgi:hypothetical protein
MPCPRRWRRTDRGIEGHVMRLFGMTLVVLAGLTSAALAEEAKHPDWSGQWARVETGQPRYDYSKPAARGQEAPLTAEYQAIYDANLKDQEAGGMGTDPTYTCIPDGMPRAMNVIFPMEIIIMPKTTYILIEYLTMLRRIYTDGRDFPKEFPSSFMGYSIGHWVDTDGDGRYDQLEIETRDLKNPRAFDSSGIPLHADAETVIKERIYADKANPDILHDEVTTIDHALTRPWTVVKNYNRVRNEIWVESICQENNDHLKIGDSVYMRSADGFLMPAKKGQPAPSLKYFGK